MEGDGEAKAAACREAEGFAVVGVEGGAEEAGEGPGEVIWGRGLESSVRILFPPKGVCSKYGQRGR